jgi:DNA polymerase I-like protein with 3'-5' exonuclease and polymerase domains
MKNYPVQGTGGEIVQIILGLLWRWFVKNDNFEGMAFLVNTVHDCVWVDAHKSVRQRVAKGMKIIMESVPQVLKRYFNIECPVPFPVEVECGPNMLDLKHC